LQGDRPEPVARGTTALDWDLTLAGANQLDEEDVYMLGGRMGFTVYIPPIYRQLSKERDYAADT
jgi:hypothetical protein